MGKKNPRGRKSIKNTTDSRVYKMMSRESLYCNICPPNKGCNGRNNGECRSWKAYRKNQWRD